MGVFTFGNLVHAPTRRLRVDHSIAEDAKSDRTDVLLENTVILPAPVKGGYVWWHSFHSKIIVSGLVRLPPLTYLC